MLRYMTDLDDDDLRPVSSGIDNYSVVTGPWPERSATHGHGVVPIDLVNLRRASEAGDVEEVLNYTDKLLDTPLSAPWRDEVVEIFYHWFWSAVEREDTADQAGGIVIKIEGAA